MAIGNPPYRRELAFKEMMAEIARSSLGEKYHSPRMDLWYYFVHRGIEVLKPNGTLSFIVNSYWTASTGAAKLVRSLENDAHLDEIFLLGNTKIFHGVSGQHMIIKIKSGNTKDQTLLKYITGRTDGDPVEHVLHNVGVQSIYKNKQQMFRHGKIDITPDTGDLILKIEQNTPLSEYGIIRQGIAENPASIGKKVNLRFGNNFKIGEGVFVLTKGEVEGLGASAEEKKLLHPYHDLGDVARYWLKIEPSKTIIYSTRNTLPDIRKYPALQKHLLRFKQIMEGRRETKNGSNSWWHLHWPREEAIWMKPKIVALQMASRPSFALCENECFVPFSMNVFIPNSTEIDELRYILAILNSRLALYWFSHSAKRRGVDLEINGNVLARIPIYKTKNEKDKQNIKEEIINKAQQIMLLRAKLLDNERGDQESVALNRQIDAVDQRIDHIVYELYNLTDEEIRIVEQHTKKN